MIQYEKHNNKYMGEGEGTKKITESIRNKEEKEKYKKETQIRKLNKSK